MFFSPKNFEFMRFFSTRMYHGILLLLVIGLWNVLSDIGSESVQVFQPHVGPVNCTSFCTYNATKIYTTSHDGTVRCADLNKLVFDQVSCYIRNCIEL